MSYRETYNPACRLPRGVGWTARIVALGCLTVGACVLSSSHPQASNSTAAIPSSETPGGVAADELEFVPAVDSLAELRGGTNVGPWTSRGKEIRGRLLLHVEEATLDALFDQIQRRDPPPVLSLPAPVWAKATISVPVASLHGDSAGMDQDMRKALKAAQHPSIDYIYKGLTQTSVQWDPASRRVAIKLRVDGTLSMAGVTRPLTMDVIVHRDSRQHYRAEAQADLLMSDFGVTPPVALFGLIKAENKVNVSFKLDLIPIDRDTTGEPNVHPKA